MAITPLITAAEAYPALEQLAAKAEQELILSFRIFDHKTPIMSPDLLERGLNTWADLIHRVARKGVAIRIILSDFDPVFTPQLHRSAWLHATGFADGIEGDVQILCAPHHQKVGKAWTYLKELRLDRGPLERDEAIAELLTWWIQQGGAGV